MAPLHSNPSQHMDLWRWCRSDVHLCNNYQCYSNLKQKFIDQIIIKHEHPDWGFGSRDDIHRLNLENENYDKSVYLKNKVIIVKSINILQHI